MMKLRSESRSRRNVRFAGAEAAVLSGLAVTTEALQHNDVVRTEYYYSFC